MSAAVAIGTLRINLCIFSWHNKPSLWWHCLYACSLYPSLAELTLQSASLHRPPLLHGKYVTTLLIGCFSVLCCMIGPHFSLLLLLFNVLFCISLCPFRMLQTSLLVYFVNLIGFHWVKIWVDILNWHFIQIVSYKDTVCNFLKKVRNASSICLHLNLPITTAAENNFTFIFFRE